MQTRHSIEAIHRVFPTNGSRPVLVTCDDFEDYVCKYRFVDQLLNEFLASEFLRLWDVPTPETCFVRVKSDHVPREVWPEGARPPLFEKECFGSKYLPSAIEVSDSLTTLATVPGDARKIKNRADFLKIAIFDLWMANEDRTGNNYNLLLVPHEPSDFFL